MTSGELWGAVLTAALTLMGAVLLFYLKGLKEEADEKRTFRRTLHGNAVEAVVDVDMLLGAVRAFIGERSSPPGIDVENLLLTWWTDGARRLKKVLHGHTDPAVRSAALELSGHVAIILGTAEGMIRRFKAGRLELTDGQIDKIFYDFHAAGEALWEFRNCVLGDDAHPNEPHQSEAAKAFWRSYLGVDE